MVTEIGSWEISQFSKPHQNKHIRGYLARGQESGLKHRPGHGPSRPSEGNEEVPWPTPLPPQHPVEEFATPSLCGQGEGHSGLSAAPGTTRALRDCLMYLSHPRSSAQPALPTCVTDLPSPGHWMSVRTMGSEFTSTQESGSHVLLRLVVWS